MKPPFVIFGLPRSRTKWLSHFLSGGGAMRPCGHDIGIVIDTLGLVKTALTELLSGTVETGAMSAWRWLRHAMPECRFFVVRRDVDEVTASLVRSGLPVARAVLDARVERLDEIAALPGSVTIDVTQLDDPEFCASLFARCHGIPCPTIWLASCMGANIQINMRSRINLLVSRASQIAGIKAEAEMADRELRNVPLPFIQLGVERWEAMEADAIRLGELHFTEVETDADPRRPFKLDTTLMRQAQDAGVLMAYAARADGELAGYCLWTIATDPESEGLLVANQGPWFVRDRDDLRCACLGTKMFDRSIEVLRERGVKCIFPHHRLEGRGDRLGGFFRRRGAKEIQRTYSLWIGD